MTRICTLTNNIILIEIILLHVRELHVRKTNKQVTFLKLWWLRDLTLHGNKMYNIINGYAVTIHSCYKFYIETAKESENRSCRSKEQKKANRFIRFNIICYCRSLSVCSFLPPLIEPCYLFL